MCFLSKDFMMGPQSSDGHHQDLAVCEREGVLDIWSCVFWSKFPGDILDVNSPEVVSVSYLISLAFFKCNSPTDCAARLYTA